MMRLYLRRFLDAEPAKAAEAMANVDRAFDGIEELLSDGRSYLVGDRFTSADLTFAALSAAVLAPDRYGVTLPQPEDAPPHIRDQMLRLRVRPAGQFAARIIAEERPWPPPGANGAAR